MRLVYTGLRRAVHDSEIILYSSGFAGYLYSSQIDVEFERCECLEWAYATCFDCEDALCEEHALPLPGAATLFVCARCLAQRQPQPQTQHAQEAA